VKDQLEFAKPSSSKLLRFAVSVIIRSVRSNKQTQTDTKKKSKYHEGNCLPTCFWSEKADAKTSRPIIHKL